MNPDYGAAPSAIPLFPKARKVQAPYGAQVQPPLGSRPWRLRFRPQSGLVQRGVLYAAAWGSENHTTALAGEEMQSPFGGCATTLPGGKHVTGFAGRLQLPYESSSFATPAVRWGGKRKTP